MSYQLKIHYAPIHELLLSFLLYKRPERLKYLDVGLKWTTEVASSLDDNLSKRIEDLTDLSFFDMSLVFMEESTIQETIDDYLDRVSSYSPGELYERITPYLLPGKLVQTDLGKERDDYITILDGWNKQYFSKLSPSILNELEANYYELETLLITLPKNEVVDQVTRGISIDTDMLREVFLIPSYHFRPLTTQTLLKGKIYILCPLKQDTKSTLLYLGKAVSDERRLSILKLLAKRSYTFTEIVKEIGSGKGNIHHHMMTLRSNGLIRTHIGDDCYADQTFSLRTRPIERFFGDFRSYINE
jgi:DNA-binding transcriptional ArsR family regulator